jgi:hypothetical protein
LSRLAGPTTFKIATSAGGPGFSRGPNDEELARGVAADAVCFDLPLVDVVTGEEVGSATECLFAVEALEDAGMRFAEQTTFKFPEGSFTSVNVLMAQPISIGVRSELTHVTSAVPTPGANSIIARTGVYENLAATVQVSGVATFGDIEPGDPFPVTMGFDDIFVVTPLS